MMLKSRTTGPQKIALTNLGRAVAEQRVSWPQAMKLRESILNNRIPPSLAPAPPKAPPPSPKNARPNHRAAVLKALRESRRPRTARSLAKQLGISFGSTHDALIIHHDAGRARHTGQRYRERRWEAT